MKSKLDQLESKLQSLFEDKILEILPGRTLEDKVIRKLAAALKQNILEQKVDNPIAPNVFTLIVASDTGSNWKEPSVIQALTDIISTVVKDIGLNLEAQPTVTITTDNSYTEKDVSVIASHILEPMEDTKGMIINETNNSEENEKIPESAFLIVEGVKVFPLKDPVVNIGRRLENHLVIDDPRISRNHSQLRAINGRYVLFDLNSTGGSFVNGQRTSQTVLYPGDVISLAGVALIFGQDNPPPRPDLKNTSPIKDANASERPTATLDSQVAKNKNDRITHKEIKTGKIRKDNDKEK
ncbi:MAG: FHA domain-containing protein [Anaerolineales bacterium]|nr:FHA domain-containing protein [Anaerolineales bacterium]